MNAAVPRIDFEAVAALALGQSADLLSRWLPAGKKVGREYLVGDLAGSPGESLSINTATGRWADFAAGQAGGDLVSLYAAMHRLSQGDAARRLAAELGQPIAEIADRPVPPAHPSEPSTAKAPEWEPILPVPADAPPPPSAHPKHGAPTHTATYRNAAGQVLGHILRCEPAGGRKQIMPLTWCRSADGRTEWAWKSLPKPRSLYGAELLHDALDRTVLVVEGEPKCDAARRLLGSRLVVVAWPGGCNAQSHADWSLLRDRTVLVWPDADDPGLQAAERIVATLKRYGCHARMVQPPVHVATGWDLGDAEREGWTAEQVMEQCGLKDPLPAQPEVRRSAKLPPIKVKAGEIDVTATEGEDALLASRLPVFRRDKQLVRPISQKVPASGGRMTVAAGLDVLSQAGLIDLLAQAVEWTKFDKRDGLWRAINPPPDVAAVILSRAALSKLPSIAGVITTPTLRPDGSVLLEAGYDPDTRLYHVKDASLHMPCMAAKPTRADAERGLADLLELLKGFPFEGDVDRSVALSAIITAVVRGALPVAPMHAFKANAAGSGKSYLADLASLIATGRPCPVMAVAEREEETEKRLVGLLLSGFPIISLDNVNGEIGGDLLCQAIERPLVRVRALGQSAITEIESRATLFATGNGLRVRGDMTRRTLIGALDAKMERPELRTFETDPAAEVLGDRGRYVAACLTIVRAYLAADMPARPTAIASFEAWNEWVRGALLWLGQADPATSMEAAREDDPELTELRELLGFWKAALGVGDGYTVREIDVESAKHLSTSVGSVPDELQHPDFRAALMKIAGERGAINTKRLARWFLDKEGRIADGLRIKRLGNAQGGVARWGVLSA